MTKWGVLAQYEAARVRESLRTLIHSWNANVARLVESGLTREDAERQVGKSLTCLINNKAGTTSAEEG